MREILFRGFHENINGESVILVNGAEKRGTWVEGLLIKSESGHYYIGEWLVSSKASEFHCGGRGGKTANRYLGMGFVLVIPETVGEFTGLLDDGGKQIFEGDFVECIDIITTKKKEKRRGFRSAVEWDKDGWFVTSDANQKNDTPLYTVQNEAWIGVKTSTKIIGTIFDREDKPKGDQPNA